MKFTAPILGFRPLLKIGAFVCLLPILAVVGCRVPPETVTSVNNSATLPGSVATDAYRVRAATTSFFRISPLQASGPDEQLKKDTDVVMVKSTRSYSRVKIASGDTGYVATEDIGPLTSSEIAAASTSSLPLFAGDPAIQAKLEAQRLAAARSSGSGGNYTIPPEAGSQEKLPEPDTHAVGPKVNTRSDASPTPNPIFQQ